jgi:hypothetical protein
VSAETPKVAELVHALNQRLGVTLRQLIEVPSETDALGSYQQANISACGIGFQSTQKATPGSHWRLALEISSSKKKIQCKGILIACEPIEQGFYWRIDFYGMGRAGQELLVQHIVQHQRVQLKHVWGS